MEFLTPVELAEKLKVQRSWVYSRTRQKGGDTIPKIVVGKYLRFFLPDVLAWLARTQSNSED